MKPFTGYILSLAILIIGGGFLGCGVGYLIGDAGDASTGTGIGSAVGLVIGLYYYFSTRGK